MQVNIKTALAGIAGVLLGLAVKTGFDAAFMALLLAGLSAGAGYTWALRQEAKRNEHSLFVSMPALWDSPPGRPPVYSTLIEWAEGRHQVRGFANTPELATERAFECASAIINRSKPNG